MEYFYERVSLFVCLSVGEHISRITHSIFTKSFVHVSYGRRSVLVCWRCDMLCTSGFMDDITFAHSASYGHTDCECISMLLQRVMSLRRRAQANDPAASYWVRSVLDDSGRRD